MIRALSGEMDMEDIEAWLEEQGIGEEDEVTVCELFDQYVRQEGEAKGEGRFRQSHGEGGYAGFQKGGN